MARPAQPDQIRSHIEPSASVHPSGKNVVRVSSFARQAAKLALATTTEFIQESLVDYDFRPSDYLDPDNRKSALIDHRHRGVRRIVLCFGWHDHNRIANRACSP